MASASAGDPVPPEGGRSEPDSASTAPSSKARSVGPSSSPGHSIQLQSGRDVHVAGDVVGRDKVTTYGYSAEQVGALLTQLSVAYRPRPFDGRCPYPGLEPFQETDAALFFGRERLVQSLVGRVATAPATFLIGPSGCGKSSLVRAGLVPALRGGGLAGSAGWRYGMFSPGRSPILALSRALPLLTGTLDSGPDLLDHAFDDPTRLTRWLQAGLQGAPELRAVLVVDPLEEVFTQTEDEPERRAFLTQLSTAAAQAGESLRLVLVLRSDFVGACARYPGLNDLLGAGLVQVGALSAEEWVRAVALPALAVGLRVDPDLVTAILRDVQDEPGALPLLQFALRDLFEAEHGPDGIPALTLEAYWRRGGLRQALRRHADGVYAALSSDEQALARDILRSLVAVGSVEGAPLARRSARLSELPGPSNATTAVVERLARGRLLTLDERSVTLAHEALLSAWPLLADQVAAGRDLIRLRATLHDDAAEWVQQGHEASYLYAGSRLAVVEDAVRAHGLPLSEEAAAFLAAAQQRDADAAQAREAARQAELERERTTARALRARNRGLLAFALVAVALLLLATYNGWNAERSAATAQTASAETLVQSRIALARAAVLQAQSLLSASQREEAAQVIAEAVRVGLAQSPLGIADVNLGLTALLLDATGGGQELHVMGAPADAAPVYVGARSLDSTRAAFFSVEGWAATWTLGDDHLTQTGLTDVHVFDASRSLGATWYLGTDSGRREVALFDDSLTPTFRAPARSLVPAALSSDGEAVLVSAGTRATLLAVATGAVIAELTVDDQADLVFLQFSPDSRRALVGSYDGRLAVYDRQGTRLALLQLPSGPWDVLAASQDAAWIAAGAGASVVIWDGQGAVSAEIALTAQPGAIDAIDIRSLAFSPNGSILALGLSDGRIELVDPQGQRLATLSGHQAPVIDLAFNADGRLLVSASGRADGSVRVWQSDGLPLAKLQVGDATRDIQRVLVLDGGTSVFGRQYVIAVPAWGPPWVWGVPASLREALEVADSLGNGRLDASGCAQYLGGPCQP